jgi:hypothetical protein
MGMKMEQTECSETLAYKIQTPGNYPEESIQHSEHGESFKSRVYFLQLDRTFISVQFSADTAVFVIYFMNCILNVQIIFLSKIMFAPRMYCVLWHSKSSPVTGLEWRRGFQEVKVPRLHDNGTGWW